MSTAPEAPCIYMHWNGGRDSVEAFLSLAKLMRLDGDSDDAMERLAALIAAGLEIPKGRTVYLEEYGMADKDNGDNGVYIINGQWEITGRKYKVRCEQHSHDPGTMMGHLLNNIVTVIKKAWV